MQAIAVTSADDPRIAEYRNVREADLRLRDGLFLAEGRLNVGRLITASSYRTRSVLVTETAMQAIRPALDRLAGDTPVYVGSQALLADVVGYAMHRGCLAAGERGPEPDLRTFLARAPRRTLVVLEDTSNPENIGSVFRNSLALGADGVVLTRRCVDPLYRRSIRVSMGASLRMDYARAEDGPSALVALRAAGFTNVALTPGRGATPLAGEREAPDRLALWLGSEGSGLSDAVLAGADRRVAIPMVSGADSLNVATASGIALHHYRSLAEEAR
jgi:tRNA G18 (ribose-2'-O)-methylase SpoU